MLASTRSKIQIGLVGLFVVSIFFGLVPNTVATPSITNNANGTTTFFEDFENRTGATNYGTLTPPNSGVLGYHKTGGSAGSAIISGGQYVFTASSTTDVEFSSGYENQFGEPLAEVNWDPCADDVDFYLNMIVTPTVELSNLGASFYIGFINIEANGYDTDDRIIGFKIQNNALGLWRVYGVIDNGLSVGQELLLISNIPTGTPINLEVSSLNCSQTTALFTADDGTNVTSLTLDGQGSLTVNTFQFGILQSANLEGGGQIKLDNVTYIATTVAEAFEATSTVTATELLSFDLSPSDTFVSANTNSGEFIRTYTLGGATGEELGNFDTDCTNNVIHGHVALTNQVIFFDCDSGTNEVESLKILTKQMTTPDVNVYCPNCVDAETTTVDIDNISGDDENLFEDIHAISYGPQVEGGFLSWQVMVQDDEGRVNTLTLFQRTGCTSGQCNEPTQNNVNRDLFQYGGTTTAFEICTQPAGTGTLSTDEAIGYAVDSSFAGAGFTLTKEVGISGFGSSVMWTIDETFAGPSGFNFAADVDCADALPRLVAGKSGAVSLINTDTAGTLCTTTAITVSDVTISKDGEWYAYADSGADRAYIYNATSCEQVASIDLPSGTFKEIELDSFGQNIYAATSTTIARYEIYTATTIDPVGGGTTPPETPPTPPTSPGGFTGTPGSNGTCFGCTGRNVFGINIDQTADGLNIPVKSVQALIGLILMVVFAIWLYRGTESVLMAMVGALAGLVVAALIGLVAMWIVMLIVLALLIIFGKMVFGAASEEA